MEQNAFEGVRVVELAQWVFVPVAGALLADWGADVIHIEPLSGDPYRGLITQGIGAGKDGVNLSMALANRGKRSLALDVRNEQGLAALQRLLESADVFLTNLRPKALQRLGLDEDTVRERFPRLIFARGHGYGVRGPDADNAGYDGSAFWARGGLAHILTPPALDYPISQRGAMGDRNGAMALAFGVAAALLRRERTGTGGVVDVSLLATAMWTLSSDVLATLGGTPPQPSPGRAAMPNPLVCTYRTKDGRHIQLMFLEADRYWADFCRVVEREDLLADARFADLRTRAENSAVAHGRTGCDVRAAHLRGMERRARPARCAMGARAGRDRTRRRSSGPRERIRRRRREADGLTYQLPNVPVQFDGHPAELRRAPEHGEHTETILLDLGYDWDEIGALRDAGAIS